MDLIVELTPTGLRRYGGNYAFYSEQKAIAHAAATQALEHLQHTHKQETKRQHMLRHYHGGVMVVSHDEHFLAQLALSHQLTATESGWQLAELLPTQADNSL